MITHLIHRQFRTIRGSRRASALVITLAFIVLLTFLVIAFLTRSQGDLSASANHAKAYQAEEIGRFAIDRLVLELQQEIQEAIQNPDGGLRATVWPARTVVNDAADGGGSGAGTPIDETDPRQFSAFRTSNGLAQGTYSGILDRAYGAGAGAALLPNVGSDIPTRQVFQGRSFDNTRWNAPRLLPYTPGSGSAWANSPTWIYLTRSGPKSLTAPGDYGSSLAAMKDSSLGNPDFVIGRYAYIMYDLGGLLDINVAGAPLSGGAFVDPDFGEKGTSAFANLTSLFDSVADGGDPEQLLTWRIPPGIDYHDLVAGEELGDVGLLEQGMLEGVPGSNVFLSRRDLLQFSRDNPTILRGGEAADTDSGILKSLRTWSRGVNAPLIDEALPIAGGSALVAGSGGATIPRYRVSDLDRDDYVIAEGDPIFQRKFPLSRIRWFSRNDVNGLPEPEVQAAIKQHFGLVPAGNLGGFTSSPEWQGVPGFVYTSPDGNTPTTEIKTLAEVAALPVKREPDFFEWLKAAIDPSSLGISAGMTCSDVTIDQDESKDFHIIQIGANILDQVDVNDLPTLILTSVEGVSDRNNQPLVAIGVENVPYINELIVSAKREGDWGSPEAENLDAWLQPEIWMPHYNENPVTALAGYNSPTEVTEFRMRVVDGIGWLDVYADYKVRGENNESRQLRRASEDFRTIVPRVFAGSIGENAGQTDDSLTFNVGSEDFRDPKLPGQSAAPNPYFNGPTEATSAAELREVFAGPEPGAGGFKGIFAGRAENCGIVPGAGGGKSYSDRRFLFTGGGPYQLDDAVHGAVRDPTGLGATDSDSDGMPDPLSSQVSFPLGEKYYNSLRYLSTVYPGSAPRNQPSGAPRPLTVILEARPASGSWIPVQILERVTFGRGKGVAIGGPASASVGTPWDPGYESGAEQDITNILPSGEQVPGYTYLATNNQQSKNISTQGRLFYFDQNVDGTDIEGGAQVPEWLGWCRPILSGEDPDPTNSIFPLGGSVAARQAIARNDSDLRNPNEFMATNAAIPGKPGAGGGNEQRFGSLYFGWSTQYNRFSVVKVDPRSRRFRVSGADQGASGGSSIRPTVVSESPTVAKFTDAIWDITEFGPPGANWNPATGASSGRLSNWLPNTAQRIADLLRNVNAGGASYHQETTANGTVVRPADYAYVPDNVLPTLPSATYSAALRARPTVLNRMFRSPAELGHVFRDVAWMSLDFFSDGAVQNGERVPTSGDTALLDVFCIEDTELTAGRIDPNKASTAVLTTLLSGALEYPGRDGVAATNALLDDAELDQVVEDLIAEIAFDPNDPLASRPVHRDSELVAALMTLDSVRPGAGPRTDKSATEAFIRGLSGSVETRTWNILIDIVAEAGRLTPTADDLSEFATSAQRRYWVFVALDRVTGRVVDLHYELVNE